jgi:hypothetical protein
LSRETNGPCHAEDREAVVVLVHVYCGRARTRVLDSGVRHKLGGLTGRKTKRGGLALHKCERFVDKRRLWRHSRHR